MWEHEWQSAAVRWRGRAAAGTGQRCCTHLSAHLEGHAAGSRQELQLFLGRREQTVSTCCICSGQEWEASSKHCLFSLSGGAGGVFSGRGCGEGGMFLPSVDAVGMPGILPHPSYLLGEPEHDAWTPSPHISAGFPMPSQKKWRGNPEAATSAHIFLKPFFHRVVQSCETRECCLQHLRVSSTHSIEHCSSQGPALLPCKGMPVALKYKTLCK